MTGGETGSALLGVSPDAGGKLTTGGEVTGGEMTGGGEVLPLSAAGADGNAMPDTLKLATSSLC